MRLAVPATIDPRVFEGWRPGARVIDLAGETMGTVWRVRLAAPDHFDPAALTRAIDARLDDIVAQMSHWRADSVLGRFNDAAAGTWFTLPADFVTVIAAGLAIAAQSGGAFDPAIGALVDLWGFGPVPASAPPPPDAIARALSRSGYRRLPFDEAGSALQQPGGLRLDLSGIAKGYAVDALAALLRGEGIHHALVEVGGELAGLGLRPDGDPWWVDLEAPAALALPPLRVALCGLAVATSGNYVRGAHNLDPRTGAPVDNGVVACSVLHARAMHADAWASALTVLGPVEGMALAESHALPVRMALSDGGERISSALAGMLDETGA